LQSEKLGEEREMGVQITSAFALQVWLDEQEEQGRNRFDCLQELMPTDDGDGDGDG
jgi:hypothetical protein